MRVELDVTCESCPLQIEGTFGSWGIYYRARNNEWQLWLKTDGLITKEQLAARIDEPNMSGHCEATEEDSLPFAMGIIVDVIETEQYHIAQALAEQERMRR